MGIEKYGFFFLKKVLGDEMRSCFGVEFGEWRRTYFVIMGVMN